MSNGSSFRVRTSCAALVLSALALALSAGCAGESAAHNECAKSAWSGTCALHSLTEVEDRELPIPYVVYEAVYTPQNNPHYPQSTPPDARLRFGTQAKYELELVKHLRAQAEVSCQSPVAQGSCIPESLVANVVPFDPDQAATVAAPRATGCAAIEAASEQDRLNQSRNGGATISERFLFDADSAALSPDAASIATAVAQELQADPTLECIGLVGQITSGESASLAEARAHAIKELLVSQGVDRGRLLTIAVTANVYGSGSRPREAAATNRRVSLSVLLKTAAPAGQ